MEFSIMVYQTLLNPWRKFQVEIHTELFQIILKSVSEPMRIYPKKVFNLAWKLIWLIPWLSSGSESNFQSKLKLIYTEFSNWTRFLSDWKIDSDSFGQKSRIHGIFLKSEVIFVKNYKTVFEIFIELVEMWRVNENFENSFIILYEDYFRF